MYIRPMLLFISTPEIIFALFVALLLFGSKRIPDFARTLGKGIRTFKDATSNIQKDIKDSIREVEKETDLKKHIKD